MRQKDRDGYQSSILIIDSTVTFGYKGKHGVTADSALDLAEATSHLGSGAGHQEAQGSLRAMALKSTASVHILDEGFTGYTRPLHIIDPKSETRANELARKTGESIPEAVVHAFEARLEKLREKEAATLTLDAILCIAERCGNLPDLDRRGPDEMLGYDKVGLFQ